MVVGSEAFQAILDESGYEADNARYLNDVFVFAGYIGKATDWAKFTHDWQLIIEAHPELQDAGFVKALMRWKGRISSPQALSLMKCVVDNTGLGSIRWRLPYSEYRKVVVTHLLGGEENIYIFAWFAVLMQAIAVISMTPNSTLDLIYDHNIVEEPKVHAAYIKLREFIELEYPDVASRLPYRPQPRSDRDFWPLRAADALAWNTHRHYIRTHIGKRFGNPLWTLLDSGPKALDETWTAEDVRDVLRRPSEPAEFIKRHLEALWESMTRGR